MKGHHAFKWLGTSLLLVALLSLSVGTALASPSPDEVGRRALFGEVAERDGDIIFVTAKNGDTIEVHVTDAIVRGRNNDDNPTARQGDRVAVMGTMDGEILIASHLMVIPRRGAVVHVTGVVAEEGDNGVTIVTARGTQVDVLIPRNRPVPLPGTVVTVVGHADPSTGIVRARSLHELGDTLERLSRHIDEIERDVPDERKQLRLLTRVRHLLERNTSRQIQILKDVIDRLPEDARDAMEIAVRNLQEANDAVLHAFSRALDKAEGVERQDEPRSDSPEYPTDALLSLRDKAEALGIELDDLKERLQQGRTESEIARDVGVSQRQYVERVLAQARKRLAWLVENGRLDPKEARRLFETLEERVFASVNEARDSEEDDFNPPGVPFSAKELAKALDLDPQDLFAEFRKGRSLLHAVEELAVTRARLNDAIMRLARDRAEHLLNRGHLTAEELERLLARFREELAHRVEEAPQEREHVRELPIDDDLPVTPDDLSHILGIPVKEVRLHFEQGGTLKRLAQLKGVTVETLIEKARLLGQKRLTHLVEAGHLSEEEVGQRVRDRVLAIRKELDRAPLERRLLPAAEPVPRLPKGIPFNLRTAAHNLGLAPGELYELLQDATLAEIAEERDISLETLAHAMWAPVKARLDRMEESGLIAKDQADRMRQQAYDVTLGAISDFRLPEDAAVRPVTADRLDSSSRPFPEVPITLADLATVLDVDTQLLARRARTDGSLLPFLRERGIGPEEFAEKLVALARQRLSDRSSDPAPIPPAIQERLLEALRKQIVQGIISRQSEPEPGKPRAVDGPPVVSVLPVLKTSGDIFRLLGVAHKAAELHERGLRPAGIARELGLDPSRILHHLLDVAEKRLVAAIHSGSLTEEKGKHLLAEFEEIVRHRVETLFAATADNEIGPSDGPETVTGEVHPVDRLPLEPGVAILPVLVTPADIFRVLGVAHKAAELRERGLRPAGIARELGFDPARILNHLLDVAEKRVVAAIHSGSLTEEKGKHLLAEFEEIVRHRVETLFAATADNEIGPSDGPETVTGELHPVDRLPVDSGVAILPVLATPADIFVLLGVAHRAAELRERGLGAASIARELGFDPARMLNHMLEVAETRVVAAIRSGALTEEKGKHLLAEFEEIMRHRVETLFAATADNEIGPSDGPETVTGELHPVDRLPVESGIAVLPVLVTPADIFVLLGVAHRAAELRERGLGPASIARELGVRPGTHA